MHWHGDVTQASEEAKARGINVLQQACLRMVKPGESAESVTYVNRVLAFIFATDDSFEELQKLPKEPFKMSCNNQLCVALAHVSLATCPKTEFRQE